MYLSHRLAIRHMKQIIKERGGITEEVIDLKIDECIANQLVKKDRKNLTDLRKNFTKGCLGWRSF